MVYNTGDRISVAGTVTGYDESLFGTIYFLPDGSRRTVALVSCGGQFSIEKLDPLNWPPQPGDVWEIDGYEYVAVREYEGNVILHSIYRDSSVIWRLFPDDHQLRRKNPRLITPGNGRKS
jgi:hypothetical protein